MEFKSIDYSQIIRLVCSFHYQACGLVKNLALMTHITTDLDEKPIARLCFNLGVEELQFLGGEEMTSSPNYLVFLNGKLVF